MRGIVTFLVCSVLIACGVAEIPGTGTNPQADGKDKTKTSSANVEACAPGTERMKAEKIDPASLKACACAAGGKARCAPRKKLPVTLVNHLDDCEDATGAPGACVPDTVIASGGAPLKECKFSGRPGRCLSLCIPDVSAHPDYFTRGEGDACPEDERCIPCEDPLTGKASGICGLDTTVGSTNECLPTGTAAAGSAIDAKDGEVVTCPFDPSKATPGDVGRFPACGPDGQGGRCLENGLVPADIATRLSSCDAGAGKPGLCVPEVYVKEKGKHLPTKCSSFAGIEGRCFSTVFKDVDQMKDILHQEKCAADERCLPCFNPANGQPTGACKTVECDHPETAAVPLDSCCKKAGETRGKCVPKSDIPAAYQPRLKNWECDRQTELCVPSDNIDIEQKPVPCQADGEDGVCVSDCVNIGFFEGLLIDRGSCRADQQCVPCVHPLRGTPTGAPGCKNK